MKTFASIFSGGELAGIGAMQAGLTPIWGVEKDASIASVAEMNTASKIIVSRAQDVDYSKLESPFWLHVSPPCTNASQANQGSGECSEDVEMARACGLALFSLRPSVFSLENVWAYRSFQSFTNILSELRRYGYAVDYWHLNSADFGVPQTRKRLFLVARLNARVQRPEATHRQRGDMFLPAWCSWLEAIEDLIPTLPTSKFAAWQLKRLARTDFFTTGYFDSQNPQKAQLRRPANEPAFTVTSFDRPSHMPRAYLVDDQRNGFTGEMNFASSVAPAFTIGTRRASKLRAFIVDGKNTRTTTDEPFTLRKEDEPCFTIAALDGSARHRAFVEGYAQRQPSLIPVEPEWFSRGRIVSMTPRALARFQSIPDYYKLPSSNGLACKVTGNAVPPLLMRRTIEANT